MKKIEAVITNKKNKELFKIVDIGSYNVNQIHRFVSAYAENKYFDLNIRITHE